MTADEATDDPRLEVIERAYAALDADDVPGFLALCSPSIVVRYPGAGLLPYGGEWHGREGAEQFLDIHDATEEILVFEPREVIATSVGVIAFGDFRGRSMATGRIWETEFVHVFVVDGRIESWQGFFDTAAATEAHRA